MVSANIFHYLAERSNKSDQMSAKKAVSKNEQTRSSGSDSVPCSPCRGLGWIDEAGIPCPDCEGYGHLRRIQRKRTKGWTMPANTVSVCRPGKWGNPFHVADVLDHYDGDKIAAQADCVRSYRRWIDEGVTGFCDDGPPCISEIRRALAGKNLACWCKQGTPCHADVLLGLANDQVEARRDKTPPQQ